METTINEIKSLLQKVRIFNNGIGTYQLFLIDENSNYVVKLSNGKISITIEELQDNKSESLTPEKLTAIANRFVPSNHEVKHQTEENAIKPVSSNQLNPKVEKKSGSEWYKALPGSQKRIVLFLGAGIFLIFFYVVGSSGRDKQNNKNSNSSGISTTKPESIHRCGRNWNGQKYLNGTYGNYCCEECYADLYPN
jgi:hypothetical protein